MMVLHKGGFYLVVHQMNKNLMIYIKIKLIHLFKILSKYKLGFYIFLCIFSLLSYSGFSQGLINIQENAEIRINQDATIRINGSIRIANGAQITQNQYGLIEITGNWQNNGGLFNPGVGTVTFIGTTSSNIFGSGSTRFYDLIINKTAGSPNNQVIQTQNLTIDNDLIVTAGQYITGTGTFDLTINGDIENNGTVNLNNNPNYVNVTFVGDANSNITGTGTTTNFNEITVNKSAKDLEVVINSSAFTAASGFLTLIRGTFHIAGNVSYPANTVFKSSAGNYNIPSESAFWLDNPNFTVSGQNATANLSGRLRISSGTFNVGTGTNQNHLLYSSGSEFILENGTVNINTRFSRGASDIATIDYQQSGGQMNIGVGASSNANNRGMFDIGASSSTFNWTGGVIEMRRNSQNTDANGGDFFIAASNGNVNNGTLLRYSQSGTSQVHRINTIQPIGELFINGTNNPIVQLLNNDLTVLGDITINGSVPGRLVAGGFNINIGGNWIHNGANLFSAGTGRVIFDGNTDQSIGGSNSTTFNNISINKSGGKVNLNIATTINGDIRLISSTAKIDIGPYNLTLGTNNIIYSDDGVNSVINPGLGFSEDKCILYSAMDETGGSIIRNVASGTISSSTIFNFPLGTKDPTGTFDVYTPARIVINEATVGANASLTVKPVPQEHPNVKTNNMSLTKYWKIQKNNITLGTNRADLRFWYVEEEVNGTEGNYRVLRYNTPNWLIDPGLSALVSFNTNEIICERPADNQFDGDWTAGEEQAARAKYYSIANGNYNDPNTWSKISFGGPPSNTAPNDPSDNIYIGDGKTVTVTSNPTAANLIEVKSDGALIMNNYVFIGDTLRVLGGGRLSIGHASGLVLAPTNQGNVQTTVRQFDTTAIYIYNGTVNQVTGNALPHRVQSLICNKPPNTTLTITNNLIIGDSLVIVNGIVDDNGRFLDGETSGRTFIMFGGEIILRKNFPKNYDPPTFNAGRVNFTGTTSIRIPSSGSTPGVLQYNDLNIGGNRAYGDIIFEPDGEIRIQGNFTINALDFTVFNIGNSRLRTDGSTIVFNGSGNQNIPRNTLRSGSGDDYTLYYHNLVISGGGVKSLIDGNHRIYNELRLESATLNSNTSDIELRGNWINTGGNFNPGTRTVTFNITTAATTKYVKARNVPFYNLSITGLGTLKHQDDPGDELIVNGNWTNTATFDPNGSKVRFSGTALQIITNTNSENFYDLVVNNPANIRLAANTNITVQNELTFESGILDARTNNRVVAVNGSVIRTGIGHVDGNLRINIPSGSTNEIVFHLGRGANYRPARLTFDGTGGNPGYLNIIDNARTVNLTGSQLNTAQNVEEQWEITIPSGSNFTLGNRRFNLILQFLNPEDIRGGANPNNFVTRVWNGTSWSTTTTGNRTSNTTQSLSNTVFGFYVIGPPSMPTYYSISNGNWNDPNTWSTAGYGGAPATSAPSTNSYVYIGDGKTVTLNIANYITAVGDSIIVETAGPSGQPGHLILPPNNIISGNGSFALRNGGVLSIGSPNGITTTGATGNIRTANRNYNENNHNNGNFIYNGTANQNTGDGLPSVVATLTINNSGNTVTLSSGSGITITDSLNIIAGTFDVSTANRSIELRGNWRNSGTFNPRNGTVTINGNGLQLITNSTNETFYNLTINKSSNYVKLEPSTNVTITNTLNLQSGIIDGRSNSVALIIPSGATLNRTSGHINGELQRYIPINSSNTVFHIGTESDYTPATLSITGTGGTAGLVSMITYAEDHPQIVTSGLDLTKNVQRYWSLFLPTGSSFNLDNPSRTYNITVQFLNPDDIRGGANTSNFVIRRYDGNWQATTAGTRTATTTEATNIAVLGDDFVVGELGASRVFYTRADGNWNNNTVWSEIAYGGPPSANWPDDPADVVFIGNGNTITLAGNRTVASVTVEDVNGMGTLNLGNYILSGNQFILKSGGKLIIGSADGITASGPSGNIQTNIRNYNHNSHNNGHFEYVGDAQNTGTGLPTNIASLTVNTNGDINLTNSVNITQNIVIESGNLIAGLNTIGIEGNWVNNSSFSAGNGTVEFKGTNNQNIQGSSNTTFNNFTINKQANDIYLQINTRISGQLNFATDGKIILNNNDLIFEENATISGTTNQNRMIVSDGSANSGNIIKYYNPGVNVSRNFKIPIGVGNVFNEAELNLFGIFNLGSFLRLKLRAEQHPNRLNNNVLSKYWRIETSGIALQINLLTNFSFRYQMSDVNGNQSLYIPARFTAGQWEVNLGNSRSASSSPITVEGETVLDGDWTAGEPAAFFAGRVFYSRQTNVNWNVNTSWSNISHIGAVSAYYPGEVFPFDTVIIANNHQINYNVTNISIGRIRVGDPSGLTGNLRFVTGTNKTLYVSGDFEVATNGVISEIGPISDRRDTLYIGGNLINNNNTTPNAVDFRQSGTRYVLVVFNGDGSDTVRGEGNWRLSGIRINKPNGLQDTLVNRSITFSNAVSTAVNQAGSIQAPERFLIQSGIYCHDVNNPNIMELDRDGTADGAVYQLGTNSGLNLIQGDIRFNDDFLTNTNTSIFIQGGIMRVGRGNNEDFKYHSGTTFTMTGGEVIIQASFSRQEPTSTINYNQSGGILRVVIARNADGIGFGIDHSSSTFTQSGGTIVITDISYPGDYSVNANTVNVTGGTLQIGELNDPFFSTSGDIAVGNLRPTIWNLRVLYTRTATNLRALICISNPLYVKNDVIIEPDGCLDLNSFSMNIGGDFINRGVFDTDGQGWDTGGLKLVRLTGDPSQGYGKTDQLIRIENPIVPAQDNAGGYRNEAFFDLIIDKPNGGRIILDNTPNSNLHVRNLLQFALGNTAIIDARTNDRYVYANAELANDQGRIERITEGHVDGKLRRNVGTGNQNITFFIGTDFDYTPANLVISGTGGTAGVVEMIAFAGEHPQLSNNTLIDDTRDIERYWRMSRPTGSFALGARSYNMTLTFLPSDVPPLANWSLFEQYIYPSGGPWNGTAVGLRTQTTTESINNTIFNNTSTDFVIGESAATDYYSYQDGPWSDPMSWSLSGYGIFDPPPSAPSGLDAQVHIGDGKRIVLDRVDSVKALIVEVAAGGPGHFDASNNFLKGLYFNLEDNTYLTTAHEFGIRLTQNAGSIRTVQRYYGASHYTYNSQFLAQSTGDGLPSTIDIASLTIDNSAPDSASSIVFLTNNVSIAGNLYLKDGNLFAGNKNIQLKGNLINDNGAQFIPASSIFEFNGNHGDQYITLNNPDGIRFNILSINKNNNSVIIDGSEPSANITISNRLRFSSSNNARINSRANNRKVIISPGAYVERLGNGHVDGILQKPIGTDTQPYLFEIGDGAIYTPATITFNSNGGTAGPVDAIAISPVPLSPFFGNRMDPIRKVDRYWRLVPQGSFDLGNRTINVKLQTPSSDLANLTLSNTVIRRLSIPSASLLWTERRYEQPIGDLQWNTAIATVELKPTANFWEGLGEFYIGEKAKRIFYSYNGGGNWDDYTSWAFDAAGTIPAPPGEFPNSDWNAPHGYEYETRDSVIIQNSDIINLNTLPELANLELKDNATLYIPDGFYVEQSHSGLANFEMRDNSWLNIASALGIQSDTSISIIRFDSRIFEPTTNFQFSGNMQQTFGDAFPEIVNNVVISNTGSGNNSIVALKPNNLRINGNLNIISGILRPINSTTEVELAGNLNVDGTLDATIDPLSLPAQTEFSFVGNNGNQNISGSGSIKFYNLNMDLGASAGVVNVANTITISNVLDLQRGANANNQIIQLGNDINLIIENTSTDAIRDASGGPVYRYIRTGTNSGSLLRNIATSGTYLYPIGSYDEGQNRYTPAEFYAGNSGLTGSIGVRVSRGTNPGPQTDGHLWLNPVRTTDYIRRYWAIDNVTTTIAGQWRFYYLDPSDISGNESNIVSVGRWRPVKEGAGGNWITAPGIVVPVSNYFETMPNYSADNFEGDWTIANAEAFRRIFYSRQSGLWNSDQTWTYSFTHSGPIFGPGVWPNDPLDSVVIGGGNLGIGNHIVTLNVDTPNGPGFGIAVGTSPHNTGTLDCGTNIVYGGIFTIGDHSTLRIGSPDGITLLGNPNGNVQTTLIRQFSGPGINAIFEYTGTQNQVIGNGLPNSVRSLGIINTGLSGNNIVSFDRNIDIQENLYINSGYLDLSEYTANTNGSGTFTLSAGAGLMIGGNKNLSTSINGYSFYDINPISIIEFYGIQPNNQVISLLPANLNQDFLLNQGGLGHVILRNSGTKIVDSPLLIRGDLTIINGATLQNNLGVDALSVRGNIVNSATINNEGVIEIGN